MLQSVDYVPVATKGAVYRMSGGFGGLRNHSWYTKSEAFNRPLVAQLVCQANVGTASNPNCDANLPRSALLSNTPEGRLWIE